MQSIETAPVVVQSQAAFNLLVSQHAFVIVYLGADWCEPCQRMQPVITQVAGQYPSVQFAIADIDKASDLASHFQLKQVPALLVVRDQVVIDMVCGEMKAHELQHHIAMWAALDMQPLIQHFNAA